MAKTVFLITTHSPPGKGGVETSTLHYLSFFEKQEKYHLIVLTYDNRHLGKFKENQKNSIILRIKIPHSLLQFMTSIKSVSALNSFFKKIMYVFLHTYFLTVGSLINLKKLYTASIIVTNGALVEVIPCYFLSLITRKRYSVRWRTDLSSITGNILTKFFLRRANTIVVNGYDIKKKIKTLIGTNNNIFVSAHGIDTKLFYPLYQKEARKKANLPIDKFIILFVAPLNKVKFCDLLIDAAHYLFKEKTDIILIFVGEGPLENKIIELKKQYPHNIIFINKFINQKKLNLFFNAADIVIGTSDIYYPSRVVLESLSCGVPVVIFNAPIHIEKRYIKTKIRYSIPLPNVFMVDPSAYAFSEFIFKNKSKIHKFRNDKKIIRASREYIEKHHLLEKIIKNEVQRLVKK